MYQFNNISENFKLYRINYPMTQQELADRTGLSVRSITRFENGGDITLSNFFKLLDALGLADRINLLIPDQKNRPSYYLSNELQRKRVSRKKNAEKQNRTFKWGDEV